jgi:hypothetical protein
MTYTEDKSQKIWRTLQKELQESQSRVDTMFKSALNSADFLKYLKNNKNKLNILDIKHIKIRFKQYGKLIITPVIIADKGRLYMETSYYPLSINYFNNVRISISDKIVFSCHYMERLIERGNITSVKELKHELVKRQKLWKDSNWRKTYGRVDVSTDTIQISRDSVSFCEFEMGEKKSEAVYKSILFIKDLSKRKKLIIDHMLDKVKSGLCILATHEIPNSINEADNVIELSKVRTDGIIEDFSLKEVRSSNKKQIKKNVNTFTEYLETYDPTSRMFVERF